MPERQSKITVLIAARYASVRAGLRALLESEAGLTVLGEVHNSEELERDSSNLAPDVILIDYSDDGGRGFIETAIDDGAAIVVLGPPTTEFDQLLTLAQNGIAILSKEAERDEIIGGIRSAGAGLVTLDRAAAAQVMSGRSALPAVQQSSLAPQSDLLSAREREVLQLLSLGLPNKQIATRLKISQHTVKFHVASILVKLGASSRTEAVTLGARRGEVIL